MPPALYTSLKHGLSPLNSGSLGQATSSDELTKEVQNVWARCKSDTQLDSTTAGKQSDITRSVLELVGREIIMSAIEEPEFDAFADEKARYQEDLQRSLDVVLTLFEAVYGENSEVASLEPGALLIPIFDDIVDLISMEAWEDLWSYFETRGPRFTKNMPSSRGKALPLLKFLNNFYRYLPRTSSYLPFRARVHEWATSVFEISDKSSVNFRGDFPLQVQLAWEDEKVPEDDIEMQDGEEAAAAGDEQELKEVLDGMAEVADDKAEATEPQVSVKAEHAVEELDLYITFWSLQTYLTHPPSLTDQAKVKATPNGPEQTTFETFRAKTDFVLPRLYDAPKTEDVRIILGKRTRDQSDVGGPIPSEALGTIGDLPRYAPKRKLFEHQLSDAAFRRQVYIQYLILIRFLLNFVPSAESRQTQLKIHKNTGGVGGEGAKSNFSLSKDDETWLRDTLTRVRIAITDSGVGGRRLRATMATVIRSEDHYAKWKSAGCPSAPFAKAAMPETRVAEVGRLWRRKVQPNQPWWHKMGTEALTSVWRSSVQGSEQLKEWKDQPTVTSLDETLTQAQADLAAISDDDPAKVSKIARLDELRNTLNWRGLRLAARTNLTDFKGLKDKRDLHELVTRINGPTAEANGTAADEAVDREAEAEPEPEADVGADVEEEPEAGVPKVEGQTPSEVNKEDVKEEEPAAEQTGLSVEAGSSEESGMEGVQATDEAEPAEPVFAAAGATDATESSDLSGQDGIAPQKVADGGDIAPISPLTEAAGTPSPPAAAHADEVVAEAENEDKPQERMPGASAPMDG